MDEDGNRYAVWPAGLHLPYSPWIGVSHLITKKSVVFDLPVRTYKTKDDVNVDIDVSLTFRIMGDPELGEDSYLLRKFVYERKPGGLEKELSDAHEEAVGALVRLIDHTEIYGIRTRAEVGVNKMFSGKESDDLSYFSQGLLLRVKQHMTAFIIYQVWKIFMVYLSHFQREGIMLPKLCENVSIDSSCTYGFNTDSTNDSFITSFLRSLNYFT